jgi:hypothetical protein
VERKMISQISIVLFDNGDLGVKGGEDSIVSLGMIEAAKQIIFQKGQKQSIPLISIPKMDIRAKEN